MSLVDGAALVDGTVVVLGDRVYAVERDWVAVPDGVDAGLPSQVAVDLAGHVHFLQRAKPSVVVFDQDGQFVRAYGEAIADPHGIYCDPLGRIFITDRDAHQIVAFDAEGAELFRLGERNRPVWGGPFNHPCDVAVGADGRIYVADGYGNARVHRFGADLAHELSWGELGRAPGQFMTPHAIWIDDQERVLVADRENGRIQRFTVDGVLIDIFEGLQNPMEIFVDSAGLVYVTDQLPSMVLFSGEGDLLGRCRPSLNGAHGLFGDRAGNFYLTEMIPPSLTRMRLLD